jgi:hypothetical protein
MNDFCGEEEADYARATTREPSQTPAMMAGAGTCHLIANRGKDGAFRVVGSGDGEAPVPPAVVPPQNGLSNRWVANR